MNEIINTCYVLTQDIRVIASYSHLIPVVLSLLLAIFVAFKAKFNLFSKIFLTFVSFISIWFVGDYIVWTSSNYNLVYAVWSFLLYIEIVFFVLAMYFAFVFVRERDISKWVKTLFIAITLVPLVVTLMKKSVLGFDQSVCEAVNNTFLDNYKLFIESGIGITIVIYFVQSIFKKQDPKDKKADLIVLGSIILFLSVFGVSEYISSLTGIYEINLYSLFILPLFLLAIIYAVFEFDIFHFNILGTHYLVVGLVVLVGGQLFFISGDADRLLTIITIVLTLVLSIILFRNLKKESDQRVRIENLSKDLEASKMRLEETNMKLENANDKLKELDKLKTEFLSLASHQLRSPLTAIKGYSSMLVDGDFGKINDKAKEAASRIFESSSNLAIVVEDFLSVSKIESGGMKYEMIDFDFTELASNMAKDLSITAEKKGLKLSYTDDKTGPYNVHGDKEKLRQVALNFIDNSIKYTKEGSIEVGLSHVGGKVRFAIKDTGMGMTPAIKASLFQKFARGEGGKVNSSGSGLGLYLAKEIAKAHNGNVGVDSPGPNLGSTFWLELDSVK